MTFREYGSLLACALPQVEEATGNYSGDYWTDEERLKVDSLKDKYN